MHTYGVMADARVYVELDEDDPQAAIETAENLYLGDWNVEEASTSDIRVVSCDDEDFDYPEYIPPPLTFDIYLVQAAEPLAVVADVGKAMFIAQCIERSAPSHTGDVWFTLHAYPGERLRTSLTLKDIAVELGAWGRVNNIPGAPAEGPWYA